MRENFFSGMYIFRKNPTIFPKKHIQLFGENIIKRGGINDFTEIYTPLLYLTARETNGFQMREGGVGGINIFQEDINTPLESSQCLNVYI